MTPTSRTTTALRAHEIPYEIVEHWMDFTKHVKGKEPETVKVRKDLFGFIDILALTDRYTVGLQVTSGTNLSARIAKLREPKIEPKVRAWLAEHRRLLLLGWRELATPISHWSPRVLEVTLEWDTDTTSKELTRIVAREMEWGVPQPTVRGVQEWLADVVKGVRS